MDRLTVKKIIDINCKKNKICCSRKSKETNKAYQDFIDSIDQHYKLNVSVKLSEVDTPIITISEEGSRINPQLYCFDGIYYLDTIKNTYITKDLGEILYIIDHHFYR